MTDDIVTRLKDEAFLIRCGHGEKITTAELMEQAADEIQRLRAEAQAFTVKLNEVLVVIAPKNITVEQAEKICDIPDLKGRVVVISGLEVRRG